MKDIVIRLVKDIVIRLVKDIVIRFVKDIVTRHVKDIVTRHAKDNRQSLVSVSCNIIQQSVLGFIQEICEDVSTILIIKHLQQSLVSLWSVFGKYLAQHHQQTMKDIYSTTSQT